MLQGVHRQLRHRPVQGADRRLRAGDRRCRQTGEQQGLAPRHRRSPARVELPHRRRRAAVQRGPRLRAPPHHAPRHAPRASARRRGAADVSPGAGAGARDGRHLSRAAARPAADHRDAAPGGDALQEDAREGPRPARRSVGQAQEGRRAAGRDGVQALRHLRLPARPHRGCAARARRHRRHQGFRRRHGAAEGGSAQGLEGLRRGGDGIDLVRGEGEDRRHRVPRLRHGERRRARSSRSSRTARKPRR